MAKPGRKPVPTRLKIIRGTDQPCRVKKNEPRPKSNMIRRPFKLSEVAGKQWDSMVRKLRAADMITNLDTQALGLYCEAYANWVAANKWIQLKGTVVKSANGTLAQSPFFLVSNKCFDQMYKMLVEFGMTPSSRTRVSTNEDPDEPDF